METAQVNSAAGTAAITGGTFMGATLVGGPVQLIGRISLPVLNAPTGSMANNGVITLGTALGRTYAKCFMWLPANSIAAGVPAATTCYYVEMSSGTAGIVYNNTYSGTGAQTVPGVNGAAAKTAFVTTGPGAYTGVTTEQQVVIQVPANAMGASGELVVDFSFNGNSTAGAKTQRIRWSGAAGTAFYSQAPTTNPHIDGYFSINNQGSASAQFTNLESGKTHPLQVDAGAGQTATVDTTALTSVVFSIQLATATDYGVIERARVLLISDGT